MVRQLWFIETFSHTMVWIWRAGEGLGSSHSFGKLILSVYCRSTQAQSNCESVSPWKTGFELQYWQREKGDYDRTSGGKSKVYN